MPPRRSPQARAKRHLAAVAELETRPDAEPFSGPIYHGSWSVPEVELRSDGSSLTWLRRSSGGEAHVKDLKLPQFVNLREATPEAILAVAKRFGPLGLCGKHGRPGTGHAWMSP